jgi:uncharacterized protein involved in response to NO
MAMNNSRDPHAGEAYRLFFPLGLLIGLAGVAMWPVHYLYGFGRYPGIEHSYVQVNGFLYCFIAGFLLTAVPRFTRSAAPSQRYLVALAVLVVGASFAYSLSAFGAGHALFLAAHLVLIGRLVYAFLHRQNRPPDLFVLVGLGIAMGLAGAVLLTGSELGFLSMIWSRTGLRLLSEGMVLSLVMGIGGFLEPRLMGLLPLETDASGRPKIAEKPDFLVMGLAAAAGLAVLAATLLENRWNLRAAGWGRAAVVTGFLTATAPFWRLPVKRTAVAWCIWVANLFILAAVWAAPLYPAFRTDSIHMLYMGGYSLLILAIATRVSLAHGNHDLGEEATSWPLCIGALFVVFGLLARIGAPFSDGRTAHYLYASFFWMAGMAFWGGFILRRIRYPRLVAD